MSDAPPHRPAAVTGAAAMLVLMATVGLAHAVLGLAILSGTVDRFRAATASTAASRSELGTVVFLMRGAAALATLIGVGVAVLLVLLALGLIRGTPGARVATWVVCGLGTLLGCGALTVTVLQRTVPMEFGPDELATEQLVTAAGSAYPDWWAGLGATLSVAQGLGYLVVAGLLALPPAAAFFRRRGGDDHTRARPPVPAVPS
ncbi:hypothetical protein [Plantactinospora sp. GCM10030261]|uniref:hypothetical protein n=1 Tax=Plantactinospora sp. GCM10030261 TaxID=3273420 RepID=UPI00361133B2